MPSYDYDDNDERKDYGLMIIPTDKENVDFQLSLSVQQIQKNFDDN